jgi:hypothetical protein
MRNAGVSFHSFGSIAMEQLPLFHRQLLVHLQNLDVTVDGVNVDDSYCSGIVVHHRQDDFIGANRLDVSLVSVCDDGQITSQAKWDCEEEECEIEYPDLMHVFSWL